MIVRTEANAYRAGSKDMHFSTVKIKKFSSFCTTLYSTVRLLAWTNMLLFSRGARYKRLSLYVANEHCTQSVSFPFRRGQFPVRNGCGVVKVTSPKGGMTSPKETPTLPPLKKFGAATNGRVIKILRLSIRGDL